MASALAALALVANALAWGLSWWPFRQLQALGVHPLWATALIYLAAIAVLLLFRPQAWRAFSHTPLLWALVLAAGLTNVGFNWAVTVGDVVRVVLLFYLMPGWVVVLAWPLLGEKPNAASLTRLALALAGVVIVLKGPDTSWPWPHALADWLGLLAGFCFALTNVLLRRLRHTPESCSVLAMFGGGAVMSALTAYVGMQWGAVNSLPPVDAHWLAWIAGLSMAFLVGNLGLQYGAARLSASTTSVIMLTEVVFASTSAVALGAGSFSARTAIGAALILMASLLAVWPATQADAH